MRYNVHSIIFIILLVQLKHFHCQKRAKERDECNNQDIKYICQKQDDCEKCITEHHCCEYCYQENYNSAFLCNIRNLHLELNCTPEFIVKNRRTESQVTISDNFTDVEDGNEKAVQIVPQQVQLHLRFNEKTNISFKYRPAKDYPLHLYYISDITYTMQASFKDMAALGSHLGETLSRLTKHYKVAFGTYLDKIEMPYYNMAPKYVDDPCFFSDSSTHCRKGYFFKHELNFTSDIIAFMEKVNRTKLSSNLDDLEGGFDALMQVLLCYHLWDLDDGSNARKLVLFVTSSEMHFAGDGLLLGATKRNRNKCYIDGNGEYKAPAFFDYPSLQEVHNEMKKQKVNMIIASYNKSMEYYTKMNEIMKSNTFLGQLKNTGEVLKLVENGYKKFASEVSFSVEEIRDYLDVTFYAKCGSKGEWKQTHECKKVKEQNIYEFQAEFHWKQRFDPNNKKLSDIVKVIEKNINETLSIHVNYINQECMTCQENKFQRTKRLSEYCVNGRQICGKCICNDEWVGDKCDQNCTNDFNSCRKIDDNGDISLACFTNGRCKCGKCECIFPYNGDPFCQFKCPYNENSKQVCDGHGNCLNGKCICAEKYIRDDCSCRNSTEKCFFEQIECNRHGNCECDQCQCNPGYYGRQCENCNETNCNRFCHLYENCVAEYIRNEGFQCSINDRTIPIIRGEVEGAKPCKFEFKQNETNCWINYDYNVVGNEADGLTVGDIECENGTFLKSFFGSSFTIAGIICLTIIIGIIGVLIFKRIQIMKDRKEYAKFEKESKFSKSNEGNPLYKDPYVSYKVPDEVHLN